MTDNKTVPPITANDQGNEYSNGVQQAPIFVEPESRHKPTAEFDPARPYASSASAYMDSGIGSPLPLPHGKKFPPPKGYTGYSGATPTPEQVDDWCRTHGDGNVALRLSEVVIGIDGDNYGGKQGGATLAEAEDRLGPLPAAPRSSSRPDDDISGIRFYRVPAGRKWADMVGPGVELVHHGHRYAVVAPSLHPTTGNPYAWSDGGAPQLDDVPWLPEAWVKEYDRGPVGSAAAPAAKATGERAQVWDEAHRVDDDPCWQMQAAVERAIEAIPEAGTGSGHDTIRNQIFTLVSLAGEGHSGLHAALDSVVDVARERRPESDPSEYQRMCDGALDRVRADAPEAAACSCDLTADPDDSALAQAGNGKADPIGMLLNLVKNTCTLVHEHGKAYAIPKDDRAGFGAPGIAVPLAGGTFRRNLLRLADRHLPGPRITVSKLDQVIPRLELEAFDRPEVKIHLRSAQVADEVILDLGRDGAEMLIIGPHGWKIGSAPEGVYFRRSHTTKPLPVPERGGRLDALAPLLGFAADSAEFKCMLAWVLGLPFSGEVRPGLLLTGVPGSGKSTRARLAASVMEPTGPEGLGSGLGKNSTDDLVRAAHRAVPISDNVGTVSHAVSDLLCSIITGTARESRELYTSNDLNVVEIRRPICLTAITVPAGLQADALDRLIVVEAQLPDVRRSDSSIQSDFDAAHPLILGAFADAISAALAGRDPRSASGTHRMASFIGVLEAIDAAELPGCPSGLAEAYRANVDQALGHNVRSDSFGGPLLNLLEAHFTARPTIPYRVTAGELLERVSACLPGMRPDPGYPANARAAALRLAHLRTGLFQCGFHYFTTKSQGRTIHQFVPANGGDMSLL